MNTRGAAACWLVAGMVYVTFEAVAAAAVPGYRYAQDLISDLGRPDSPLSHLMNAAFVVQGTLFLGGAVLLVGATRHRDARLFTGFAAANAVGNIVVASVPSGPSGVAGVHVTGAFFAIVGGNAAILVGAPVVRAAGFYRAASVALAALGLVSFVLLALASTTTATMVLPAAVWERTSVYTIIGWQILSAIVLLVRRRRAMDLRS